MRSINTVGPRSVYASFNADATTAAMQQMHLERSWDLESKISKCIDENKSVHLVDARVIGVTDS